MANDRLTFAVPEGIEAAETARVGGSDAVDRQRRHPEKLWRASKPPLRTHRPTANTLVWAAE